MKTKAFLEMLKGGRPWLIAAVLSLGVLLIIIGGCSVSPSGKGASNTLSASLTEYERELEAKIKALCESVNGVSRVTVAVSIESGYEYVYAQNSSDDYVLVGSGSSENGMFLKEKPPKISGVGIVCAGGGDPKIQNELLSLISAACGIGTNKIFIAEAQK